MRYIYFIYDEEKNWIEMDDKAIANRQVIQIDGIYHVSALEDCLAEGQLLDCEIDANIIDINKEDFENIWNESLKDYKRIWSIIKNKYKLNSYIKAFCMYYYPQGVIFKVDNVIINYIGKEKVKIHEEYKMRIVGYDDVNMWIITE